METVSRFWGVINRKKTLSSDVMDTPLSRCLNTFDMTLLGIGHMIGAGIYVITGTVVKTMAGPAAILSYAIAGVAAILASLCYAEFGARIPKAGSAYSYTYVTIGEFWAFVIGWNVVLEHLIGVASVARAWSGSVNAIFNDAIKNGTIDHIGRLSHDSPWFSEYPDFVAVLVIVIITAFIITGAKISTGVNNVFTILNAIVMAFIIVGGFYLADLDNWKNEDSGGFFPMGFQGVFGGAAACFYAYIGFEGIAIAGEEARDPERSIPRATLTAMVAVTTIYVVITSALTLMVPYYAVVPAAAYPAAFALRGLEWMKYIVAFGSLFGITTSLVGGLFSLPRSVYAMASDGVFFKFFARVYSRTQTPVYAIAVFSGLAAIMAFLLEIEALVEFMSIGTLMAYTIVAASVIIMRYLPVTKCQFKLKPDPGAANADDTESVSEKSDILKKSKSHDDFGRLKETFKKFPILKSVEPGNAAILAVVLMLVFMTSFSSLLLFGIEHIQAGAWWSIILLLVLAACIVACFLIIVAHEQNDAFLTFQVSWVS